MPLLYRWEGRLREVVLLACATQLVKVRSESVSP